MRPPRRHLLPVAAIAFVAVLCLLAESVAGLGTGLTFLAPALLLVLPLLAGRYLGEDTLVRFRAQRAAARPRRRTSAAPRLRRRPAAAVRGGRLLAASLAERGPPAALPV